MQDQEKLARTWRKYVDNDNLYLGFNRSGEVVVFVDVEGGDIKVHVDAVFAAIIALQLSEFRVGFVSDFFPRESDAEAINDDDDETVN